MVVKFYLLTKKKMRKLGTWVHVYVLKARGGRLFSCLAVGCGEVVLVYQY